MPLKQSSTLSFSHLQMMCEIEKGDCGKVCVCMCVCVCERERERQIVPCVCVYAYLGVEECASV